MEVTTCPQCGSKITCPENIRDVVLNDYTLEYTCKDCGYSGMPIISEKYEGIFQGLKPPVPGFVGVWEISTRLSNGEKKVLSVLWDDARDCIQTLQIKKGDKIKVTIDEKIWCIEKL